VQRDLLDLIPALVELARAAGRAALAHYRPSLIAREKRDGTPVTDADEAAEAIIIAGLSRLAPEIPVISEEEVAKGRAPFDAGSAPPRFWLVDPLDGTREFVAGNGEFCINIGLAEDRRALLGVLHAPVDDLCWTACGAGTAARRERNDPPRPIRARPVPPTGNVVLSSRSHGDGTAFHAFLEGEHVAEQRRLGSARKLALIAEGSADLYPRFGPTSEWDTCAGQAILEAAGGRVETLAGAPLAYGKPGFRNPDFIARGRARG
jgi:3'(2'), 5'-bisphosphate nucleotidase